MPNHGEDDGERPFGRVARIESDMQGFGTIDDGMDGMGIVTCYQDITIGLTRESYKLAVFGKREI